MISDKGDRPWTRLAELGWSRPVGPAACICHRHRGLRDTITATFGCCSAKLAAWSVFNQVGYEAEAALTGFGLGHEPENLICLPDEAKARRRSGFLRDVMTPMVR